MIWWLIIFFSTPEMLFFILYDSILTWHGITGSIFDWLLQLTSVAMTYSSHCVKSVRIRSFSSSYFPTFGLNTEKTIYVHINRFSVRHIVSFSGEDRIEKKKLLVGKSYFLFNPTKIKEFSECYFMTHLFKAISEEYSSPAYSTLPVQLGMK